MGADRESDKQIICSSSCGITVTCLNKFFERNMKQHAVSSEEIMFTLDVEDAIPQGSSDGGESCFFRHIKEVLLHG